MTPGEARASDGAAKRPDLGAWHSEFTSLLPRTDFWSDYSVSGSNCAPPEPWLERPSAQIPSVFVAPRGVVTQARLTPKQMTWEARQA